MPRPPGDPLRLPPAPPERALEPGDPGPYGPRGRSAWLDVDWSRQRRVVDVGSTPVNVVDLGAPAERAVVFVHGLSGSWHNWLETMPYVVARGLRAVALDLPGFGESPMPPEKISISGYARCVDGLMDRLGIEAAAVVGNSMGGFIGAELAIRFPPRVERLVLVSAAGLTVEHQRNERALATLRVLRNTIMASGGWIGARSDALARRRRARWALLRMVAHRPALLPGPLIAAQIRGSGKAGFVDALDALTGYPIRDRLPRIACPTLIVWGTEDRLVPVSDADEFERLIANSRKVVWRETGHVPMLERPAGFNALLGAFLDERPGERVDARADGGEGGGAGPPEAPRASSAA